MKPKIRINDLYGTVVFLILWEITVRTVDSPILIRMGNLFEAAFRLLQSPAFWNNLLASLRMLFIGYAIAVGLSFVLSVIVYNIPLLNTLLTPVLSSTRNVAAVSIVPILIVLLGIEKAKIAAVIWTAYPAIFVNTMFGYRSIEQEVIDAARLDGATEWQVWQYMRLPLAKRYIVTGLMLGVTGAWITLVTAEAIGSTKGIGYAIIQKTQLFQYADAYIYILVVALASYLSLKTIHLFESEV